MLKFFYYNIYQIFFSRFLIINLIFGKIFIFDKKKCNFFFQNIRNLFDLNTYRQIFIKEDYNLETTSIGLFIKRNYKKKLLILDCGSNIGASTNYFSLQFPSCKIIGIEPDIDNYKLSIKNTFSSNILIYNSAISCRKKIFKVIKSTKSDPRGVRIKEDKKGLKKTLTIKEILDNKFLKMFKPFIIKIDIEGSEKDLFQSNTNWINNFPIIIIELHDWMIKKQNISSNFIKKISKIKNKDIFIKNENLVVVNYNLIK